MRVLTAFALLAAASLANAEVKLPALFASHMVLQRDQPIHVWGWADPNETIAVQFGVQSGFGNASTTADAGGSFSVYLPPVKAGGPYQLTVRGSNSIQLDDVLVGDVWFASGQSNMEFPMSGWDGAPLKNSQAELQAADHPDIRLFLAQRTISQYPLQDYQGTWSRCTPEAAAKFSAVAYFFGREIASTQHVPIGLIDATWGGTPAESWTSIDTLSSDASLMPVFATWAPLIDTWAETQRVRPIEKAADDAAKAAGNPVPRHQHGEGLLYAPSSLYNGMVAPAVNFRIRGAIWYQGEANAGQRAKLYDKLFAAMIEDWRRQWHEGDFPFFFVQLANFNADATWPVVREAQRRALRLNKTGMAVSIDIGEPTNIHPANKQDVGARLALAARAIAYDEKIEYSGPIFRQVSTSATAARVWFDHAHGLMARGSEVAGFEVAAEDRKFFPAQARIDGETVLLTSPQVAVPKYVRYGWAGNPTVNLYNAANLPASPFTSEDVPQ